MREKLEREKNEGIAKAEKEKNEVEERLQREKNELNERLESELDALSLAKNEEIASLQKELTEQRLNFEATIASNETEIKTLREDITTLKTSILGLEEQVRLNEDIQAQLDEATRQI